jgi:preprotein translocase subunit SecA
MRELERFVILQVVDQRWREHLEAMDYLREGVHLRAMAQKDPLVEYQHEGHLMFGDLGLAIHEEVVLTLFHAQLAPEEADALQQQQATNGRMQYEHESLAGADAIAAAGGGAMAGTATMAMTGGTTTTAGAPKPIVKSDRENIGRNDPCWCGSGKKFKKCHGA